MKKRQTKASKIKWTASSDGQFRRCARCGIWHDQDLSGLDTWYLVGPTDDPDGYALCSRCYVAIMRRQPDYLDVDTYLTLVPSRWPRRGRKVKQGSRQPMTRCYTAADREAALRVVKGVVPKNFVVGISPYVANGRLWVRIDDAPFPSILPWRIIRVGRVVTYSTTAPDTVTYPPLVAAVIKDIRTALAAAGVGDVDISLSQVAAERQARQILDLTRSAHGRMRLAGLLAAAGLDDEAIAAQLDWLDLTS